MKAVIYARYSSSNQTELSIEGQIQECLRYAAAQGILVVDVYTDRAVSSREACKRPSFMKMLKDSAARTFEMVLVYQKLWSITAKHPFASRNFWQTGTIILSAAARALMVSKSSVGGVSSMI